MIPGSANPLLLASAVQAGGYAIDRSLRFNAADSAYLSRTPASAGNRKTWTWAGWVKRCDANRSLFFGTFDAGGNNGHTIEMTSQIQVRYASGGLYQITSETTEVCRDFSAWFHLVVAFDTTQATQSDRLKLYINGTAATLTGITWALNTDYEINSTVAHGLARCGSYNGFYFNGYLADVHFIDGQALDPTSFGEFDANGIWQPKAYTGTYGTNGFHLAFSDNSTAGSLGDDSSDNGNNWTVNNISIAAGAGDDSLIDVPTNGSQTDTGLGGEVKGNYATLNVLSKGTQVTLSNGNLDYSHVGDATSCRAISTIAISSGKWYCEHTCLSSSTLYVLGIALATESPDAGYIGQTAGSYGYYALSGNKYNNGSSGSYGTTYGINDIIGIAFDADNGTLTFYKNGVSQGTAYSSIPAGAYVFGQGHYTGAVYTGSFNFGQRPFAYTAPSGFKALCTANLPSTTITTSGSYTGNGVADGPFVFLNGVPTAMTVNGNAVTFGTHADKLSNGLKIRTTSTTFNQNASTYNYSITTTGDPFKTARAQSN